MRHDISLSRLSHSIAAVQLFTQFTMRWLAALIGHGRNGAASPAILVCLFSQGRHRAKPPFRRRFAARRPEQFPAVHLCANGDELWGLEQSSIL